MSVAASDQLLYQIVSEPEAATIADVLARMQRIDQVLADNDGLKWFNRLYSMVTEEVDLQPPAAGWKDEAWLDRLDVVFAGLYFKAVRAYISKAEDAPNAWDALMEARFRGGIDRIQFALAGMKCTHQSRPRTRSYRNQSTERNHTHVSESAACRLSSRQSAS